MSEQQTGVTEVRERNFLERWFGIYFSPAETYESINKKPDWIMPLLLLAVISTVALIVIMPVLKETQIQAIMDRQGVDYDQAIAMFEKGEVFFKYVTPVISFIGVFIVGFAIAGIFFLIFNYILGGESSYKKVLSVYSYTAFAVGVVATIVRIPLVLAKGSLKIQTSLAAFLPDDMQGEFLYRLLAKFDIFTIWQVVLLITGFSVIYRFSRGKSAAAVLTMWAIYIIFSVIMGGMFGGMQG